MTDGKIPAYDETTPTDSDADTGVLSRSTDDGGDVAEQRDPDTIQREIEQTRAELADTIDAIADRISPKRAASRGAQAVKTQVSAVFNGQGGASESGGAPASVLDAPASSAAKVDTEARRRSIEAVAREGGGAAYAGTTEFSVARRLRTDRVLLLAGAVAAAAGVIILWRARD